MLTKNWKCVVPLSVLILFLTAMQAQAATISVDVGPDPSPTQSGFTAWHFNQAFDTTSATSVTSPTFFLGADDFTAELSDAPYHPLGSAGDAIGTFSGGATSGGALSDLEDGTVFGRQHITFGLSGLDAGTYTLTTYHFRTADLGSEDGEVISAVTDSLGTNAGASVTQEGGTGLHVGTDGIGSFTLVSDGSDMSIQFDFGAPAPGNIYFNGFTLESAAIPEPSTLGLAGIGLFGLLACGRRRRRRDEAAVLNRNST